MAMNVFLVSELVNNHRINKLPKKLLIMFYQDYRIEALVFLGPGIWWNLHTLLKICSKVCSKISQGM